MLSREHHRRRSPESSRRRRRERRDSRERHQGQPILTSISPHEEPSPEPYQEPFQLQVRQPFPEPYQEQYQEPYQDTHLMPYPRELTPARDHDQDQDHDSDRDVSSPYTNSSSSSTSSSLLNVSRPRRGFGLGLFFSGGDRKHRRRVKKKRSRILGFGNSSSSSVGSDLAYGRGYIDRRGSREFHSPNGRRPRSRDDNPQKPRPKKRAQTDEEIIELGRKIAEFAREQNAEDLRAVGKTRPSTLAGAMAAINQFRRTNSGNTSRGVGSSKPRQDSSSDDSDDSDWESAASSDEESSEDDVDSGLAYGSSHSLPSQTGEPSHISPPVSHAHLHPEEIPLNRKRSLVDPKLFGPVNSLRGFVEAPCGFERVDRSRVTSMRERYEQSIAPPESVISAEDYPLQRVVPVPTSDPSRFDVDQGSTVSVPRDVVSRPRPEPVPIQHPKPIAPVYGTVLDPDGFDANFSTSRTTPKVAHPDTGAGLASGAGGTSLSSDAAIGALLKSALMARKKKLEGTMYEDTPWQLNSNGKGRQGEREMTDDVTRNVSSEAISASGFEPEPAQEDGGEKRRSERRVLNLNKGSQRAVDGHEAYQMVLSDILQHKRRGEDLGNDNKVSERIPHEEERKEDPILQSPKRHVSTESEEPIIAQSYHPMDPFQYQVADDAFPTPRYPTPAQPPEQPVIMTIEREPDFSNFDPTEPLQPLERLSRKDSFERELREAIKARATGQRIKAPPRRAGNVEEAKSGHTGYSREESPEQHVDSQDPSRCSSSAPRHKDPVLDDADRAYREARRARRIIEEEERSRSNSPDSSVLDKWKDEKGSATVQIVSSPIMDDPKEKNPYDKPNADVRIDNILEHPQELSRFRISGSRHQSSPTPPFSARDPSAERDRPVLNLVRPTPAPSPSPEKRRLDSYKETVHRTVTNPDPVPVAVQDEAVSWPSSPLSKPLDMAQNKTSDYASESQEQEHDDYSGTKTITSPTSTASQIENKVDWDAAVATVSGVGIGVTTASIANAIGNTGAIRETVRSRDSSRGFQRPSSFSFDMYDDPPTPGPKPGSSKGSRISGRFAEDPVFMANIAAGLESSGFDPNMVIESAVFHQRESPPGSDEALISSTTAASSRHTEQQRSVVDSSPEMPQSATMNESDLSVDNSKRHSRLNKKQRRRQRHASHGYIDFTPASVSHDVLPEASHSASQEVGASPISDGIGGSQVHPHRAARTTAATDDRIHKESFAPREPESTTADHADTIQSTTGSGKLEATATTENIPSRDLQSDRQYTETQQPSELGRSASIPENKDAETVLSEWERSICDSDEDAESMTGDATQIIGSPLPEQSTTKKENATLKENTRRRSVIDEESRPITRDSELLSESQLPPIEPWSNPGETEEVGAMAENKNTLWSASDPEPVAEFIGVPQTAGEDLNEGAGSEPPATSPRDCVVESDRSLPNQHEFTADTASPRHSVEDVTKDTGDTGNFTSNLHSEGAAVSDEEWKDLPWRLKKKKTWHRGSSTVGEELERFDGSPPFRQSSNASIERPKETSTRPSDNGPSLTEGPSDALTETEAKKDDNARSEPGGFPEDEGPHREDETSPANRDRSDLSDKKSGSSFGFINRLKSSIGLSEDKELPHEQNDDNGPFLDKAGTLATGAGLIGTAIALVTNKDRPEPTDTARSISSRRNDGVDEPSLGSPPLEFIDPEIVQREIRPAIDPTYGDLLPLPPSRPASPVLDLDEDFPPLPESRPGTPESDRERRLWTQQSPHVRRRSDTPLRVKTPSNSAIPIQFRLGQRTGPVSPNLVRASPGSPIATASETSSVSRPRSRPMSWENTKTFKPLLLVEKTCRESIGTPTALHEESQARDMARDPPNEFGRTPIRASEVRDPIPEDRFSHESSTQRIPFRRYSESPLFPVPGPTGESGGHATASDLFDPVSKNRSSYLYYSSPSSAERTKDGDMSDSSPTLLAAGRRAALQKLTLGIGTDDSLEKDAPNVEPGVVSHRDSSDNHSDVEELPASIRDDLASSVLPLPDSSGPTKMTNTNRLATTARETNEISSPQNSPRNWKISKQESDAPRHSEETTSVVMSSKPEHYLTTDVLDSAVQANTRPRQPSLPMPSEHNIPSMNKEEYQEVSAEFNTFEPTVPPQVQRDETSPATTELDRGSVTNVGTYPIVDISSPKAPIHVVGDDHYTPDGMTSEVLHEDFHEPAADISVDASTESPVMTEPDTHIQAPLEDLTEQLAAAYIHMPPEVPTHSSTGSSSERHMGGSVETSVHTLSDTHIKDVHVVSNDNSENAALDEAAYGPIEAPMETSAMKPVNTLLEMPTEVPMETLEEEAIPVSPISTIVKEPLATSVNAAVQPPYEISEAVPEVVADPLTAPLALADESVSMVIGDEDKTHQSEAHESEASERSLAIRESIHTQDGDAHDESMGKSPIQTGVLTTVTREAPSTVSGFHETSVESQEEEAENMFHQQFHLSPVASSEPREQPQAISDSEMTPLDMKTETDNDIRHSWTPTSIDLIYSELAEVTFGERVKNSNQEQELQPAAPVTSSGSSERISHASEPEQESAAVEAGGGIHTLSCNDALEPQMAKLLQGSDPIMDGSHAAVDSNPSTVRTDLIDYYLDLLADDTAGGLEQSSDMPLSLGDVTDSTTSRIESVPNVLTRGAQECSEHHADQADELSVMPAETRIMGVSQSSAPGNENVSLAERETFNAETQQETEPTSFAEHPSVDPVFQNPPVPSTEYFKPADSLNTQLATLPNAEIPASTSTEANTPTVASAETWTKKKSKKGKKKRQSTSSLPELDHIITTTPTVESIQEPQINDTAIVEHATDVAFVDDNNVDDVSQEALTTDSTLVRSVGSSDNYTTNHTEKERAIQDTANVVDEVAASPEPVDKVVTDALDATGLDSLDATLLSDPISEKLLADCPDVPLPEKEEVTEDKQDTPIEDAVKPWLELDQIVTQGPIDDEQIQSDISQVNADQASLPTHLDPPEVEAEVETVAEAPPDTFSSDNLLPTGDISGIQDPPELLIQTNSADHDVDMIQSPSYADDWLQSLEIYRDESLESSDIVVGGDTSPIAKNDSDTRLVSGAQEERRREPSVEVSATSVSVTELNESDKERQSIRVTEPVDESLKMSGEGSNEVAATEFPANTLDDLVEPPQALTGLDTPGLYSNASRGPAMERGDRIGAPSSVDLDPASIPLPDDESDISLDEDRTTILSLVDADPASIPLPNDASDMDIDAELVHHAIVSPVTDLDPASIPLPDDEVYTDCDAKDDHHIIVSSIIEIDPASIPLPSGASDTDIDVEPVDHTTISSHADLDPAFIPLPEDEACMPDNEIYPNLDTKEDDCITVPSVIKIDPASIPLPDDESDIGLDTVVALSPVQPDPTHLELPDDADDAFNPDDIEETSDHAAPSLSIDVDPASIPLPDDESNIGLDVEQEDYVAVLSLVQFDSAYLELPDDADDAFNPDDIEETSHLAAPSLPVDLDPASIPLPDDETDAEILLEKEGTMPAFTSINVDPAFIPLPDDDDTDLVEEIPPYPASLRVPPNDHSMSALQSCEVIGDSENFVVTQWENHAESPLFSHLDDRMVSKQETDSRDMNIELEATGDAPTTPDSAAPSENHEAAKTKPTIEHGASTTVGYQAEPSVTQETTFDSSIPAPDAHVLPSLEEIGQGASPFSGQPEVKHEDVEELGQAFPINSMPTKDAVQEAEIAEEEERGDEARNESKPHLGDRPPGPGADVEVNNDENEAGASGLHQVDETLDRVVTSDTTDYTAIDQVFPLERPPTDSPPTTQRHGQERPETEIDYNPISQLAHHSDLQEPVTIPAVEEQTGAPNSPLITRPVEEQSLGSAIPEGIQGADTEKADAQLVDQRDNEGSIVATHNSRACTPTEPTRTDSLPEFSDDQSISAEHSEDYIQADAPDAAELDSALPTPLYREASGYSLMTSVLDPAPPLTRDENTHDLETVPVEEDDSVEMEKWQTTSPSADLTLEESKSFQENVSPAEASEASDLKTYTLKEETQQANAGDPVSPTRSKKNRRKKKRASLASLLDAEASAEISINALDAAQTNVNETVQDDVVAPIEPASIPSENKLEADDNLMVDESTTVDAVPSIPPTKQSDESEDCFEMHGTDTVAESPVMRVSVSPNKLEQDSLTEPDGTSIMETSNTGEAKQSSASVLTFGHEDPTNADLFQSVQDHIESEYVTDSAAPKLADNNQPDGIVHTFEELSTDQDTIIIHARETETVEDQPTINDGVPENDENIVSSAGIPGERGPDPETVQEQARPDVDALHNEGSALDSDPAEHQGSTKDVVESRPASLPTIEPADEVPAVPKSKRSKKKKRSSVVDSYLMQGPSQAASADIQADSPESIGTSVSELDPSNDRNNADFTLAASDNIQKDEPSHNPNVPSDETTKGSPVIAPAVDPAPIILSNDIPLPDPSPAGTELIKENEIAASQDNDILSRWSPTVSTAGPGYEKTDFPADEFAMSAPPGTDNATQPTSPSTKKKDKKKRKKKKKQVEDLQDRVEPEAETSERVFSHETPTQEDTILEQPIVGEPIQYHAPQHPTADVIQEEQLQRGLAQDRPLSEPLPDQSAQDESTQEEPTSLTRHRRHTSAGSLLEKTVTGAILREYVQRQSIVDAPIQESSIVDDFVKEQRAVEDHVEQHRPDLVQEEHIQTKLSDLNPLQALVDDDTIAIEHPRSGAKQRTTQEVIQNVPSQATSVQEHVPEKPAEESLFGEPLSSSAGDVQDSRRLSGEMLPEPTLDDLAQILPSQVSQGDVSEPAISLESEDLANDEPAQKDSLDLSSTKKNKKARKKKQGNSQDIESVSLEGPPLEELRPITTTELDPIVELPLKHEAAKVTIPNDDKDSVAELASAEVEEKDSRPPLHPRQLTETVTNTTRAPISNTDDQIDRGLSSSHKPIQARHAEPSVDESGDCEANPSKEGDINPRPEPRPEFSTLPNVSTVTLEGDGLDNAALVDKNEDIIDNNPNMAGETLADIAHPEDAVEVETNPEQGALIGPPIDSLGTTRPLQETLAPEAIRVPESDQTRLSNIDTGLKEASSKAPLEETTHQPTRRAMEAGQYDKAEESKAGSSNQNPLPQEPGTELPKETVDKGIERADTVWKKKSKKDKKKKKRASQVSWEEPTARIEDLPQQQPARVFDEQPMTSEPVEMGYNNEAVVNPFSELAPDNESTSKNLRQSQVDWEPEPNIENAVKEPNPLLPAQQDQGNDVLLDPRSLAEDTETSLKDSIDLDDNSLQIISSYMAMKENEADGPKSNLEPPITKPDIGLPPAEQQVATDTLDPNETPTNDNVPIHSKGAAKVENTTPTIISPGRLPARLIDPNANVEHPTKNGLNIRAHDVGSVESWASGYSRLMANPLTQPVPPDEQSDEILHQRVKLSIPPVWDAQQSILDDYGQVKPTMILQPSDSWRKASPRPEEPNRHEPLWREFELSPEKKDVSLFGPNSGAGLQPSHPHNATSVKYRFPIHPDLSAKEARGKKPDKHPTATNPSREVSEESSSVASERRPRTPSPKRTSLVDISHTADPSTPPNKELHRQPVDYSILVENTPAMETKRFAHTSRTPDPQNSPAQQVQKTTPKGSPTNGPDKTTRKGQHGVIIGTSEAEVKPHADAPEDIVNTNAEDSSTVAASGSVGDEDFWVSPSTRMVEQFNETSTDTSPEAIRMISEPLIRVGVSPIGTQIKDVATAKKQPNQDDTGTPGQSGRHDNPLQSGAVLTLGGPFIPSLPPPCTPSALDYNQSLAPVKEESHEDLERASQSSPRHNAQSPSEADRDSGFVPGSPTPQRGSISLDNEGQRDSGVHLRESGEPTISGLSDEGASSQAPRPRARRLRRALFDKETSQPSVSTEANKNLSLVSSTTPGNPPESEGHKDQLHNEPHNQLQRSMTDNISDANQETMPPLDTTARRSFSIASISRMRTPESRPETPASHGIRSIHSMRSLRSAGTNTPPLRRMNRRMMSGDLRGVSHTGSHMGSHTSPPNPSLSISTKDKEKDSTRYSTKVSTSESVQDAAKEGPPLDRHAQQSTTITPVANEGRVRSKDMPDVYDGYGEGRIGSPRSPTRPPSMRRRQSMQVLELESRVEQLLAENRALADARARAEQNLNQRNASAISDRDAEIEQLKASLQWLRNEVTRLTEVNEGLQSANSVLALQHNEKFTRLESQNASVAREIEESRGVRDRYTQILEAKDAEIQELRNQLEAAKEQIRAMKKQILDTTPPDADFLRLKDEDHFDNRCQQLCSHVQQWVLRFSKFSDMRACRLTSEINDEKIIDRLDNTILDGSDVDDYLRDRVARRDIFMSMTMNMIWEFIFTRYLFGMDREQRQKLKSLEKNLTEVGPTHAVRQWRAITLTLLSRRRGFADQCSRDREAVVQAILHTLSMILPPPSNLELQIQHQLRRVMSEAVDLAIEMRTQRAEYMMIPPLQPEYDANGELTQTVAFNAALMHERSGDSSATNEEYEAKGAIVRCVLFPLVVKRGNDYGMGDDEIVISPAQVLVAKPRRSTIRMVTPSSDVGGMSLISDTSPSAYEKSHVSVNMQDTPLTPEYA